MIVAELMQRNVRSCAPSDTLKVAAQIMWEQDCGSVPIVDPAGQLVGMITDRDICMAAYLRSQRLDECLVGDIMSRPVVAARPSDPIEKAETAMRDSRVRRLPVIDESGHLTGILSLNDLALASRPDPQSQKALAPEVVTSTLAAICQHRQLTAGAAAA